MNQDQDQSGYQAPEPSAPQQAGPMAFSEPLQPTTQPVANHNKSKKIIAIVVGSLMALAIIAGVLWYFLWWQNPNRMVSRAMLGVVAAEKFKTSGKATLKLGDKTFTSNLGSSYGGGPTGLSLSIGLDANDPSAGSVDFSAVIESEGAIYLKADNLSSAFDVFLSTMTDQLSSESETELSQEELDTQNEFISSMIKSIYGQTIDSIDGKWLRLAPSALDNPSSQESKCVVETIQKLQTDKAWINEVKQAYQKNNFLIVKEEVASNGGSRGFVIDADSEEVEQIASQFMESLKQTDFGKKIIECDPEAFGSIEDTQAEAERDSSTTKLTVWVDKFSHKLTSIEFTAIDPDDKLEFTASIGVMIGEADKVEVPTDAQDIEELLNSSNPFMVDESYFDQSDAIIVEDEETYTQPGV